MTTTVPTHGGPAVPVSSDTSGKTMGRVALRAYGFPSEADAIAAGFHSEAGPASSVYVVSAADLVSGKYVLEGDPQATPIYAAPAGMRVEGGYSQPVYLVGGSLSNAAPPVVIPWWKAGGATGCIQALQPLGAASLAASLIDLSGSGNNASSLGADPAFNPLLGWTFAGGKRLNTGIIPVLNSYTMIVQYADSPSSISTVAGCYDGVGNQRFFILPDDGSNHVWYANGNYIQVTPKLTSGNLAMAGVTGYRNGSPNGTIGVKSGEVSGPIWLGCSNGNNGTPAFGWSGSIKAFALYNHDIGAAKVLAVATAMAALKPSFSTVSATSSPSGQAIRVYVPTSYSVGIGAPLILYHHGASEDQNAPMTDTLKQQTMLALLNAGYIVASSNAYGDNWGNANGVAAMEELYTYVTTNYTITRTMAWSQSMGGLTGLLSVAAGTVPYKGWLGTYPVCNLANMFNNNTGLYAPNIRTAYGIAADGSDYAAKTSGHDPVLLAASAFDGKRMRFYASSGDGIVSKSNNTDAMAALVTGHATEYTIVPCTGTHGDPSHFQPSDYLAFFNRCI